ncbi:MarR family transcriptional regulator [Saccharopolyspora shandongensis]|uniref:MarR family winged helix-turn-helix transcriptional regulator n=1 Tax=Saccharopolyspora shandongensis TaxID=418495 RepID=UPI00343582BA
MDAGGEEERLGALFLRLAKSAHVLQRRGAGDLGLTPAQARALFVLGRCETPPRMAELAERLHVVPRAVTPIVDALEEAGLLRREVDPGNRRSTLLELTPEGRKMCKRLTELRARAAGELFAPLTAEQRRTLLELLEKVDQASVGWYGAANEKAREPRRGSRA